MKALFFASVRLLLSVAALVQRAYEITVPMTLKTSYKEPLRMGGDATPAGEPFRFNSFYRSAHDKPVL